ncbi:ELMO domain-containing protein A-like isoform X1 [Iris pallida]|uniref:ELMO domain-containing protein A-like isoform X1 n=1 Tax=Iris pallida TaxID=29817 RepID=A0AAX6IF37_IRIPA|nr:ELMO domain-containing protein A-like isoform X1 [Iris pallida]
MDDSSGTFVAVRRLSQGLDRSNGCHSSSAEVAGSSAWIGRGLSCVCAQRRDSDARLSFDLTPYQEDCLLRLQSRIDVTYDSSKLEHQESLRALWHISFPEVEFRGLISEHWKEMGWQGKDPSTDFRGGGFISLENLLFFAKNYPKSFQHLLRKQEGDRSMWEYPFAVAGVNITFMLIQMLDLQAVKPRTMMGAVFLKLLSENERAFDLMYCVTFQLMDHQWLEMHASYMDFNSVMKATRRQLERELLLEDVQRVEDMPSYRLLLRNFIRKRNHRCQLPPKQLGSRKQKCTHRTISSGLLLYSAVLKLLTMLREADCKRLRDD